MLVLESIVIVVIEPTIIEHDLRTIKGDIVTEKRQEKVCGLAIFTDVFSG